MAIKRHPCWMMKNSRCSPWVSNRPATCQLWLVPYCTPLKCKSRITMARCGVSHYQGTCASDEVVPFLQPAFGPGGLGLFSAPSRCRLEKSKERTEWPEPTDHPEMVVVYGIGLKNIRIFKLELCNLQFRPSSHVVSMFSFFWGGWGLEQSPRCALRAVVPLTSALRSLLLCRCLP